MEYCRVCLEVPKTPIHLSQQYKKKFFQITSIQLNETKKECLCKECYELLLTALKLRKDAIEADEWFRKQEKIKDQTGEQQSDTETPFDDVTNDDDNDEEEKLKPELKIEVFIEELPGSIELTNEKPIADDKKYMPKKKDPYICYFCNKKIRRYVDLVKHMKVHKQQRRMTCRCCEKLFTDKAKLANHEKCYRRRMARGCSLVCQHCGSVFTEPKGLAMHSRIHTGKRNLKCTIDGCTEAFREKRAYYRHIVKIHHIARPCVCKDCGISYTNHISLNTHRRKYHNEDTQFFICTECPDKKYLTQRGLDDHIAFTHRGERNHICSQCPKSYGNQKNLARHIRDNHREFYVEMIQKGKIRENVKNNVT